MVHQELAVVASLLICNLAIHRACAAAIVSLVFAAVCCRDKLLCMQVVVLRTAYHLPDPVPQAMVVWH